MLRNFKYPIFRILYEFLCMKKLRNLILYSSYYGIYQKIYAPNWDRPQMRSFHVYIFKGDFFNGYWGWGRAHLPSFKPENGVLYDYINFLLPFLMPCQLFVSNSWVITMKRWAIQYEHFLQRTIWYFSSVLIFFIVLLNDTTFKKISFENIFFMDKNGFALDSRVYHQYWFHLSLPID